MVAESKCKKMADQVFKKLEEELKNNLGQNKENILTFYKTAAEILADQAEKEYCELTKSQDPSISNKRLLILKKEIGDKLCGITQEQCLILSERIFDKNLNQLKEWEDQKNVVI